MYVGSTMIKKIIYPGTFDPITYGHIDIINRATNIFDTVIIAVAEQNIKNPRFTLDERYSFIKKIFETNSKIEVQTFSGLLISFAKQQNVMAILRGLRTGSDFEYEFQLAGMNNNMDKDIETIFLIANEKYSRISSSIVREIAFLGGDVSPFVPKMITNAFKSQGKISLE